MFDEAANFRFIPTGVGNTDIVVAPVAPVTVHPHGRGEHEHDQLGRRVGRGSSPRAWGTQAVNRAGVFPFRFIPTGVGNTANV